mgnify:CR=1 FL=1
MNNNVEKVIKETELDLIEAEKVIKETELDIIEAEKVIKETNELLNRA